MKTGKLYKSLITGLAVASMCMPMAVAAETKDVSEDAVEDCVVTASAESEWTVTIPKKIVLDVDGEDGTGSYTVSAKGKIDSTHEITVTPDAAFEMKQGDDRTANATVTQEVTAFDGATLTLDDAQTADGEVNATGFVAGEYEGTFDFHIAEAAK